MTDTALISGFVENGYALLPGAFTPKVARPHALRAIERFKALPPRTLRDGAAPLGVTLPHENGFPLRDLSPAAYDLVVRLVGGEERLGEGVLSVSDGFVVAPPDPRPWIAPNAVDFGWHIDGDGEALRTIDSPEVGLILYALWSDTAPRGGGTFFAPGALPALARHLFLSPQGRRKSDLPYELCLRAAKPDPGYFEMTGKAGTMLVTHSLMIHAASRNSSAKPRLLSARTVPLRLPLKLEGVGGGSTPLERATLRALEKAVDR